MKRKIFGELAYSAFAFYFCVVAQAVDVVSSLGASGVGTGGNDIVEANPFSRHANGAFWFDHAVIGKIIFISLFALISIFLYRSLKPIHVKFAKVVSVVPYIYLGIIALQAAFMNILIMTGMGRF